MFCRFLTALFLVMLALPAAAQTAATTTVSGTVIDAQRSAVAGAVVKLTDAATNHERASTTDERGRYRFYAVDPGHFTLTVAASGFKTRVVTNLEAEVSRTANVDVVLEVGGIEVVEEVPAGVEAQLQTADASIGGVFNEERLRRLPNFSRQATSLFFLQAATMPQGQFAGARQDQSTYTLDGVDISDNITGFHLSTVIPVPVESLSEMRVTVANANATFGRSSGGQISLVTKRGGNEYHGGLYLYHQDNALAANSWTNNRLGIRRPFLLDNRFGGTLGGPVFKERTFFFTNYEGRRNPRSQTFSRTVPTESLRAGVLRFRDASGAVQTIDSATIKALDPRGLGPNQKVLDYLRLYPAANNFSLGDGLNTAGFTFIAPLVTRNDFGMIRLDHKFSDGWTGSAKFSADRQLNPGGNQVDLQKRTLLGNSPSRPRNLVGSLTGVLTSKIINEARFSWLHERYATARATPETFVGLNVPINLSATLVDDLMDVDTQRARTQGVTSNIYQLSDTLTWIEGAHTIQTGANIRRIHSIFFRNDKNTNSISTPVADISTGGGLVSIPTAQRPSFIQPVDFGRYNDLYAGLLGVVSQVPVLITRDASLNLQPVGTGLVTDSTFRAWEFYFSDTWRWKRSLTLTYGLTYNWQEPPVEKLGRQTVLTFKETGQLVDFNQYIRDKRAAAEAGQVYNPDVAYTPVNQAGRTTAFNTDYSNLSPRFSAAWNPSFKQGSNGWLARIFGEYKTVVRGGYSIFFDRTNTVQTIVVPSLSVGFAQTANLQGPKNGAGQPFRIGIDGLIPLPSPAATISSPIVLEKPYSETNSFSVDPFIRVPRNHVIDFTIQREFPFRMLIEVGYIGRFVRNLYVAGNLNSVPFMQKEPRSGQTFAEAFDAVATQLRQRLPVTPQPYFENYYGAGTTLAMANAQAASIVNGDVSSLQQNYLDLQTAFLGGRGPILTNLQSRDLTVKISRSGSNYHGLIFTLRKRHSRGLAFDLNYTLSKYLDQVYTNNQNVLDQLQSSFFDDLDYGPSDFDVRHMLNANGTYDLPFGKGHRLSPGNPALNKLVGGWFIGGIFTARSGYPVSTQQNFQAFGGGSVFGSFASAILQRKPSSDPGVYSGVTGSNGIGINSDPARRGTGLNLFENPEQVYQSFRPISLAQDRRTGRGVLRGLGDWNIDGTIGKETQITEKVRFTLSFDFINPFNRVSFSNPFQFLNLQNPAAFGVLNNQFNSPRRIQVGGRIDF